MKTNSKAPAKPEDVLNVFALSLKILNSVREYNVKLNSGTHSPKIIKRIKKLVKECNKAADSVDFEHGFQINGMETN